MSKVISESADNVDMSKVADLTTGLLQSFHFAKIPNLVALASLAAAFENVAKNMLDQSATGQFHNNKLGILRPLDRVRERISNHQPPEGYVDLIV